MRVFIRHTEYGIGDIDISKVLLAHRSSGAPDLLFSSGRFGAIGLDGNRCAETVPGENTRRRKLDMVFSPKVFDDLVGDNAVLA